MENLNALVVRTASVATGLNPMVERVDANQQVAAQATGSVSLARQPSQGVQVIGYPTGTRHDFIGAPDKDRVAVRAGRPGARAGVLSRSPASSAGRTVLSGWAAWAGTPCPQARLFGPTGAITGQLADMALHERLAFPKRAVGLDKQGKAMRSWRRPLPRAFAASTGGKNAG
jgi:hypothetical protein